MLAERLRDLADDAPMSATTRSRLRKIAKEVEVLERDNEVMTDLARKMLKREMIVNESPVTQSEKPTTR